MKCRYAAWLLVASASCSGDPFVGDVSHSRYFEYHDQVQEPLCRTLLDRLDQHAEMIGSKIGLTLDTHNPYRYFRFTDLPALLSQTSCHNGACALGDAIYSTTYFHAHEQAHDYAYRAWGGWSNGLLDEGQAVAMSCMPFYELQPNQKPSDVVGMLDWRDLLHLYGDSDVGYGAAGFFVTHLANQYGWDSVGAFYKKVSWGSSVDDVAQAFAEVFPTSMDQAWSDALNAPGAAPCQRDWQCMATAMAVGDVATPDCDGEMHRSVEVGAPGGGVALSMTGDYFTLRLISCSDPTPTFYELDSGRGGHPITHWASLPPGSYAMFQGPAPSSVTLQSNFSGSLVGATCATAGSVSVSLDPNATTIVDFPFGRLDGWMPLAGSGHSFDVAPYGLFWDNPQTPGPLAICTDCSGTSCVPVPYGQVTPTRVTISDQSVVRFQNVQAQPPLSDATWGQLMFFPVTN